MAVDIVTLCLMQLSLLQNNVCVHGSAWFLTEWSAAFKKKHTGAAVREVVGVAYKVQDCHTTVQDLHPVCGEV